ncbi:hypothetical protein EVG20_g5323 [Dentipellis fragilis]|uniref:Uncharacterized protein n=1 Tax=Dentipellis fragilis TaxID=205917 RepID=A0A4Y9YXB4_9AGAM|nr:hypothetical protein EVG20_g5323 [Dentipellis fragilis]
MTRHSITQSSRSLPFFGLPCLFVLLSFPLEFPIVRFAPCFSFSDTILERLNQLPISRDFVLTFKRRDPGRTGACPPISPVPLNVHPDVPVVYDFSLVRSSRVSANVCAVVKGRAPIQLFSPERKTETSDFGLGMGRLRSHEEKRALRRLATTLHPPVPRIVAIVTALRRLLAYGSQTFHINPWHSLALRASDRISDLFCLRRRDSRIPEQLLQLYSAAGQLFCWDPRVPVNRYSPDVRSYQAWCDHIDFQRKTLQCMPATPPLAFEESPAPKIDNTTTGFPGTGTSFSVKWDKLVIAVGAYSQTFNVPGVKEHAHFLKDVKDARAIRTRILECFEQANQPIVTDVERRHLLNFCIVGGGPTGVEFAAELHDLLHTDMARHYPALARMAKISLYDVAPQILGNFDRGLAEYAEKKFRRDGITLYTSHHVERVESGKMYVKEQGEVHFGLLVWSTGLAPNPLIQSITELKKNPKTGSIITNDHLNALQADGTPNPDVWAIGDAAIIDTAALPATAQVANQKARYLTKKLNRIVKDKDAPEPFEFHNQGTLAYLGDWKAIYDRSQAASGPKNKETGRLAWLLWRSAYFTMTLSLRNKILIPTYWDLWPRSHALLNLQAPSASLAPYSSATSDHGSVGPDLYLYCAFHILVESERRGSGDAASSHLAIDHTYTLNSNNAYA